MSIYAIGDLHLSFTEDKPMDIFGENWINYENKIKAKWLEKINDHDTVLIPGDISWALSFENANVDLSWIDQLPGRKIISKGNHDYWWSTLKKMKGIYENVEFLYNNYFSVGEIAICGTRGWTCPNDTCFTKRDEKIYRRELLRLRHSLDLAVKDGYTEMVVMLHYPPTNDKKEISGFVEIIESYNVKKVIYGHLHSKEYFNLSYRGIYNDVEYSLVSCDAIDFDPIRIF
mgnify:CR=1 FL=1